jgi:hypothetical protein
VSGPACVLVEDPPQRHYRPGGDPGPFGVPRLRGSDRSFPPQGGTPNEGVRNEANSPRATGADVDRRGRRRSRRWARLYKRSQFADTGRDRHGPEKALVEPSFGPTAPNEPNFQAGEGVPTTINCAKQTQSGRSDTKGKCFIEKELWRIRHARSLGKTKPIPTRTTTAKGRQGCRCRRRDPSVFRLANAAPDGKMGRSGQRSCSLGVWFFLTERG